MSVRLHVFTAQSSMEEIMAAFRGPQSADFPKFVDQFVSYWSEVKDDPRLTNIHGEMEKLIEFCKKSTDHQPLRSIVEMNEILSDARTDKIAFFLSIAKDLSEADDYANHVFNLNDVYVSFANLICPR